MIISFGRIFSDFKIERTDAQRNKAQVIGVPIAYGPKEKWLRHIQENPDLSKQTMMMELPRMSFELDGYMYDPSRKIGPNLNYVHETANGRKVLTPAPWNFDINLYIVSRTQDDMMNIMEQILPFFSPALSVDVQIIDDPKQMLTIPIIMNGMTTSDNWDTTFDDARLIVNTLNFTMKGFLFGPVLGSKIIKRTIVDFGESADILGGEDFNTIPEASRHEAELDPFEETKVESDPHVVREKFINF